MLALAICSLILITVEANTRLLESVRSALSVVVAPVLFVADTPYLMGGSVADLFSTRRGLLQDKTQLERRVVELSHISQQFAALQAENARLRELLGSKSRLSGDVLVAELVSVEPTAVRHEVVVDKGSADGVYLGQAVIDAQGLFGQVVEVSPFVSRILQITDVRHAVPVEVSRSGVKAIAAGTGQYGHLELENVPMTADLRQGDLLVSSGLGGRFPPGYPVGVVDSVHMEQTQVFAAVTAVPSATLDRSRHVLMVFDEADE